MNRTSAPADSIEALAVGAAEAVSIRRFGETGVIILNRPEARNALRRADRIRFADLVAQANADPELHVLIVTGTGGHFCAGVDIKEPAAPGFVRPNPGEALRRFSKLSIAAVDGVCIGGGLEIALSCSFIFASDRAQFADFHAKRGILPAWGMSVLLPAAVGVRRAREMTATGRVVEASDALTWGLANRVVPAEELFQQCLDVAMTTASFDTRAVEKNLDLIDKNARCDCKSAFEREAATAFKFKQARQTKGAEQ